MRSVPDWKAGRDQSMRRHDRHHPPRACYWPLLSGAGRESGYRCDRPFHAAGVLGWCTGAAAGKLPRARCACASCELLSSGERHRQLKLAAVLAACPRRQVPRRSINGAAMEPWNHQSHTWTLAIPCNTVWHRYRPIRIPGLSCLKRCVSRASGGRSILCSGVALRLRLGRVGTKEGNRRAVRVPAPLAARCTSIRSDDRRTPCS